MENEKNSANENKKAVSRVGFFIALACCFVALCIGTITTVNNLSEEKAKLNNAEDVGRNLTNVPATQARERYSSTTRDLSQTTSEAVSSQSTSENTTASSANYVYPIENTIINAFSDGQLVYSETMHDYRIHDGIDISAEKNEKVKAFSKGNVIKIYKDDLYGDAIIINHGDELVSYYFGVLPVDGITEGVEVSAGSIIGTVSSVLCESADESHIHFAVQKGENFINPVALITP